MKKAITLLSGGLDSMVSTAIARKKHKIVLALTFDYGQRAAKREISAAKKLCRLWKIKHKVIDLKWLAEITNTALVNNKKKLPLFSADLAIWREYDPARVRSGESAKAVWVPNRNGLFINIAASFAESLSAGLIITGFNREEAKTFPDNSAKFVQLINETLKYSTLERSRVVSYTQNMTKSDMVKYAIRYDLPINLCWPCYKGGKSLCGQCESCVRFLNALKNS